MSTAWFAGLVIGIIMNLFVTKSPLIRHLYCISTGLVIWYFTFGKMMIHPLLMAAGTYLIIRIMPRNISARFATAWVFIYMTC